MWNFGLAGDFLIESVPLVLTMPHRNARSTSLCYTFMRKHFSSHGPCDAELEIVENEFRGGGGNSLPHFVLSVRLDAALSAKQPRDGLEIISLTVKIWIPGVYSMTSNVGNVNHILQEGDDTMTGHHLYLEFPATPAAVNALEKHRNGGELKFTLDATLSMRPLVRLNAPEQADIRSGVWGIGAQDERRLQTQLLISRDVWITQVLPSVGYGVVHILEFSAAPVEACAALEHSFKALKQAQHLHQIGHYDDAVGKCRVALDQFFDYVEKSDQQGEKEVVRRVPMLKKAWETKLGAATYAWLDSALGAIKDASNRTHHSPNTHYDQLESQMILAVTTAVVAYAARSAGKENSQ